MNEDQKFLRLARNEGNKNKTAQHYGAVVVKDGKVIARAHNQTHELHDPSAHAEILALKKAGEALSSHNLNGCVIYGSHEPCVMCYVCAVWANVERVVYARPASNNNDSYEFKNLSLEELASKLTRSMIKPELIAIKE